MMSEYIDKMIQLVNMNDISTAASLDGRDIFYEADFFTMSNKKTLRDSKYPKRKMKNVNFAISLIGSSPDELSKYMYLQDFLEIHSINIYYHLINLLENGSSQQKKIIATGVAFWCFENNCIDLLKINISPMFLEKNIKKDIKTKYKGFIDFFKLVDVEHKRNIDSVKKNISILQEMSDDELNKELSISKLRTEFREALKLEGLLQIENYRSWNNGFEFPDAAHIIGVKECLETNRIEDITNPNNGILLDPNTHRLLDRGRITKIEELRIPDEFLNEERLFFLKMLGLEE